MNASHRPLGETRAVIPVRTVACASRPQSGASSPERTATRLVTPAWRTYTFGAPPTAPATGFPSSSRTPDAVKYTQAPSLLAPRTPPSSWPSSPVLLLGVKSVRAHTGSPEASSVIAHSYRSAAPNFAPASAVRRCSSVNHTREPSTLASSNTAAGSPFPHVPHPACGRSRRNVTPTPAGPPYGSRRYRRCSPGVVTSKNTREPSPEIALRASALFAPSTPPVGPPPSPAGSTLTGASCCAGGLPAENSYRLPPEGEVNGTCDSSSTC